MAFDIKITIKKFFTGLGLALIPVILLYSKDFLEGEEFPPEYAWVPIVVIPILHALINYWKHKVLIPSQKIERLNILVNVAMEQL